MKFKIYRLALWIAILSLLIAPLQVVRAGGVRAPASQAVTIRWLMGFASASTSPALTTVQQVVADFNAAHPGIQLVLEAMDNSVAFDRLRADIAAGNPPDIVGPIGIWGSNQFPGQWLDLQPLVTANNYDLSDFDPEVLNVYQESGEGLIGIPLSVFPSFIYYNKALFDQAGLAYPPHQYGQPYTDPVHGGLWTIEKLEEIALLLTSDSNGRNANDPAFDPGAITKFGYYTQWTDLRGEATLFGASSLVDGNGDAQIPAHWQDAFEWHYAGMWEKHFMPTDSYTNSEQLAYGNPFSSGNVAMVHLHSWYACCLNGLTNWDIAAVPTYNGTATAKLHADTFRIHKATAHPNEAFEVYTYLVGDAAPTLLNAYSGIGGLPARQSLLAGHLTQLSAQFPGVDWQVAVDSLNHSDQPNHESRLPNFRKSIERLNAFQNTYRSTPGLDLNTEINQLQSDLQAIFHTPALQFSPAAATLGVGNTTIVLIDLNEVSNVYGYQFQVNYDATKVSATGAFANAFFDTAGGTLPPSWNASCATGICQFAVSRLSPTPGVSGSGTLAQITFTGLAPGVVNLTFSSDVLSDPDGTALDHTADIATVTVYGYATLSGTVKLQGRASPGDATGTVTLTDISGVFSPLTATIATDGTWSANNNVPVMPTGSTYQLDAAHSLYLGNQRTGVTLMPGNTYAQPTTTLKGGDANNDGTVSISDLSCIGGDFGGSPGTCGGTGSSDINGNGTVNILDLVLAGGNYGRSTPQPW